MIPEKVTSSQIVNQLRMLGVNQGDVLLVTADLARVGLSHKNRKTLIGEWYRIFDDLLGPEGTIVIVSFTRSFFRFAKNNNICFTRYQKSTSGALSQMYVDLEGASRSTHPTNSIIAFGKQAESICKEHTEKSMSFDFVGELIKLNAKHLMLGTLDNKNAPAGFHYAQQIIGETKSIPGVGLSQSYYINFNGHKKLFTRWDGGGCSGAGYKLIGHHILHKCVNIGVVGDSLSGLFDVEQSVNVCLNELKTNRNLLVCDDKMCLTCYGRFSTSGFKILLFYPLYIYTKLPGLIKRIKIISRE
jgi:aminoglycoside 3-N-acetyltransferase